MLNFSSFLRVPALFRRSFYTASVRDNFTKTVRGYVKRVSTSWRSERTRKEDLEYSEGRSHRILRWKSRQFSL